MSSSQQPAVSAAPSNITEQLKRDEGFKQFPYRDTKQILTIGYGFNLSAMGLNRDECEAVLRMRVADVIDTLENLMPWCKDLDDARFGVLCNMAYNVGTAGLLEFKETLTAVKERRYDDASRYMLASLWAKQVGARAQRLARQMLTGEWQ